MRSVDKRMVKRAAEEFVKKEIEKHGTWTNFITYVKEKAKTLNVSVEELMGAKLEYFLNEIAKTKIEIYCSCASVFLSTTDLVLYIEDKIYFVRITEQFGSLYIKVGRVVFD